MQIATRRLRLEAELAGPADGAPLLMVMGLGMQLVDWPQGLLDQLHARGFRTIVFDNRDAGLSERLHALGAPNLVWQGLRHWLHLPVQAPYALDALAEDTLALIEALDLPRVHLLGLSMGGMVAQLLALRAPERLRSLTLMMTSSGARHLPGPSAAARAVLTARPAAPGEDAVVEQFVTTFTVLGSPAHPPDVDSLRAQARRSVRRAQAGGPGAAAAYARQLAAVVAAPDRSLALGALDLPTLVIHGQADPLLPAACGRQLAACIPGARLDLVPGLGHDLPPALWPRFVDALTANALRAA